MVKPAWASTSEVSGRGADSRASGLWSAPASFQGLCSTGLFYHSSVRVVPIAILLTDRYLKETPEAIGGLSELRPRAGQVGRGARP